MFNHCWPCQSSSYCGRAPTLTLAEPSDLNIVCGEHSLTLQPEQLSEEEEIVLAIERIANHPSYTPGTNADKGANLKGPYAGSDIAAYHLTYAANKKLKDAMKPKILWPACLPKLKYSDTRGIFGGWLDQEPFYRTSSGSITDYQDAYQRLKTTQVTLNLHYLLDLCYSSINVCD